jgi:hypothetical protein
MNDQSAIERDRRNLELVTGSVGSRDETVLDGVPDQVGGVLRPSASCSLPVRMPRDAATTRSTASGQSHRF